MNNTTFNLGDKVFHKSDPLTIWIIEKIDNNEAYCSTLNNATKELKKEKFDLVTLEKKQADGGLGIYVSGQHRKNHY